MAETTTQISSSIDALMREFDIITHNLANVSTAGYKRICNAFSKVLEAQEASSENYTPGNINLNSALDFSQGNLVETGRPLDLALAGRGFFVIETPDGPLYTRHGIFHINQNGQIVDSDGRLVAGQGGPITIPSSVGLWELNVSTDGTISAQGTTIGKFRFVDFGDNESKLIPVGASCYSVATPTEGEKDIQPVAAENIIVKQGYQEASNVKIVDELVDMILVARLYEANMKLLSSQQEISSSIIGVAMG